jgi:multidrug resistance efflux pump
MTDKTITVPRVSYDDMLHTARRIQLERDELRAEVERLRARLAEAERLIGEYQQIADGRNAEIEQLRAAVLAYDDAVRNPQHQRPQVAVYGGRVVSQYKDIDYLYADLIRAAGRDPEV